MERIPTSEPSGMEPCSGPNVEPCADPQRYWIALAVVVAVAIAFRLFFFIGFVGADPHDDAIYINTINSMVKGTYSLAPIRNIIAENRFDPAHIFQLRMSFLMPVKCLVLLFGPNDFGFILFPFLCSIFGVILAYFFVSLFGGDRELGLITAFLLAVYPLDCAFATKISPDVPLGLSVALTVFFFARGEIRLRDNGSSKEAGIWFFLSGMFFSLSHGMKVLGVVLPSFFLLYFLVYRRFRMQHLFVVLGFIPFFALLSYYYYANSGDPFLQNTLLSRAQVFNVNALWALPHLKKYPIGFLEIIGSYGGLFEYTKYTFAFKAYSRGVVHYFTIYYPLMLLGGVVWALYVRKRFTADLNRIFAIWLIWVVAGYITLEFAPVSIEEIFTNKRYCLFPKHPRFHAYLSIPVVCIGALCFSSLRRYRKIMFTGLFFVAGLSAFSLHTIQNYYHDGLKDIKDAAAYIQAHPEKTYYTDYLATGYLKYRLHYNPLYKIEDVNHLHSEAGLGDGILILGGARGVEINGDASLDIVPQWAKQRYFNPLEHHLVLVREYRNPLPYSDTRYRKHDMKILAVAGAKESNP
ncbi:MAG: glycosyltransferase family 39 protein [Deltaproteobacteria bacterium]|nr:glycosyltransferase family 39 protein [Deltaproteobacteria bacterium]